MFPSLKARPLLPKERVAGETVCVRLLPGTNQIVLGRDRVFTFDQVFSAASTQVNLLNLNFVVMFVRFPILTVVLHIELACGLTIV